MGPPVCPALAHVSFKGALALEARNARRKSVRRGRSHPPHRTGHMGGVGPAALRRGARGVLPRPNGGQPITPLPRL